MKCRASKGFTLIELLVVIAVIGILASVVLASLNSARAKSRDAKRKADLTQVRSALELYMADYGAYPSSGGTWRGNCSAYGSYGTTGPTGYIPNLAPTYIPVLPLDPKPVTTHGCYLYNSDGIDYKFLAHQTIESVSCPPLPASFGFYDPDRSGTQCTAGVFTPGAMMNAERTNW